MADDERLDMIGNSCADEDAARTSVRQSTAPQFLLN
jgi:hypothetical protein